jgi:hypothetical protein
VFISENAGASWTPLNNGLTHGNVTAVRVDPVVNEVLHAATLGGGVFEYEFDRCNNGGVPIDCGSCRTCDPELGCIGAPLPACRQPALAGKARLRMKNDSTEARDHFVWTWARGAATALGAFGDPTTATGYEMCIFDESGGAPALLMRARIDPGGVCKQGKPCWKPAKKGFKYRNGEALPDGLTKLLLKEGETGKAKIVLKGRGAPLPVPEFPLPLPLRFQLRNDLGECWEGAYTDETTVKNDATRFNAKSAP